MTKIKLCGLSRNCDIDWANALKPDYIGFVFAKKSRRYVTPEAAAALKATLQSDIRAVGVFVNEPPESVAALLNSGIIDVAQLHGAEDETYLKKLRGLTGKPVIQAFKIAARADLACAKKSSAEYILLDSGSGGTGYTFDWDLIRDVDRPYFLAGGLSVGNVQDAVRTLRPWAVDVSSGIETDGKKDVEKMKAFVEAVRDASGKEG